MIISSCLYISGLTGQKSDGMTPNGTPTLIRNKKTRQVEPAIIAVVKITFRFSRWTI
jgi:hypothetical protein